MDRFDLTAAAGVATTAVGLWLLQPWISLTVVGLLLAGIGVAGGVLAARADHDEEDGDG